MKIAVLSGPFSTIQNGDAAELYAPPDGYVDASGAFHRERQGAGDKPVYEVTLRPEDGRISTHGLRRFSRRR